MIPEIVPEFQESVPESSRISGISGRKRVTSSQNNTQKKGKHNFQIMSAKNKKKQSSHFKIDNYITTNKIITKWLESSVKYLILIIVWIVLAVYLIQIWGNKTKCHSFP